MEKFAPTIWEDDKYVYVPEELFELLPEEFRAAAQARKEEGSNLLRIVDDDLQRFVRLGGTFQALTSLQYNHRRLRALKFEATTETFFEHELLTTAFVVTYSRVVSGRSGVSRTHLPAHLREVHDDLIEIRNKRYAHDDDHKSIRTGMHIDFDETECRIALEINLGFHWGGRNEWEELVTFLDGYMYKRLQKTLGRLKDKTGREWKFPIGPGPVWSGTQG
ncbi:hypothetical protein [Paraburkholderia dipogonis]|uniref:hypothetical protein n=1 Tax=Paraburkholderia dipogonis TaxID=1211383 RepID=UPI0038BBFD2F